MAKRKYPAFVQEVLVDNKKYRPAALRAVKKFAKSKPWKGSLSECQTKFRRLNRDLAKAYGVKEPQLVFGETVREGGDSGTSCYIPGIQAIILRGRLSVVTYLHEFAHHLFGSNERKACRWSINLFRRCFPRSWTKLDFDGHMVRRAAPSIEPPQHRHQTVTCWSWRVRGRPDDL